MPKTRVFGLHVICVLTVLFVHVCLGDASQQCDSRKRPVTSASHSLPRRAYSCMCAYDLCPWSIEKLTSTAISVHRLYYDPSRVNFSPPARPAIHHPPSQPSPTAGFNPASVQSVHCENIETGSCVCAQATSSRDLQCDLCPEGTYFRSTGATRCIPCREFPEPGYASYKGQSECTRCPRVCLRYNAHGLCEIWEAYTLQLNQVRRRGPRIGSKQVRVVSSSAFHATGVDEPAC